jgi:GNAT superfamily N-acetyltransferase
VLDASATFIAGVVSAPSSSDAGESATRIRVATPDDVATLFDIRTSVRENHQGREELATLGVTPATVGAALATTARAWIAEDMNGESLGFAMADASVGTLFALFVRPQAERRGIGRALLDVAESWLFSNGWQEIWLLTGVDPSLRAHGVYRAAGWLPGEAEDGQVRYTKRSG